MAGSLTVVVSSADLDGLLAGAVAGRAAEGTAEAVVFDAQKLFEFFGPAVQQRLPRGYNLVLCGLEVVHIDWDGRLVRPRLMDALRNFLGPIRWFSAGPWDPDDRQAVGHIVGEGNVAISQTGASVAGLVLDTYLRRSDGYEDSLVRLAEGRLTDEEEESWGRRARMVLTALKADPHEMAAAVAMLMDQRLSELLGRYAEQAVRTDETMRRFAGERAQEPRAMDDMRLVVLGLPPEWQPFHEEVSAYARQEKGAEFSLCHLEGRSVLLLECSPSVRVDLRTWARYVTDLMPAAEAVGARPGVVPLVVRGLAQDVGLRDEVLGLLAEGAYLLKM
jgi:hypothetical protein